MNKIIITICLVLCCLSGCHPTNDENFQEQLALGSSLSRAEVRRENAIDAVTHARPGANRSGRIYLDIAEGNLQSQAGDHRQAEESFGFIVKHDAEILQENKNLAWELAQERKQIIGDRGWHYLWLAGAIYAGVGIVGALSGSAVSTIIFDLLPIAFPFKFLRSKLGK